MKIHRLTNKKIDRIIAINGLKEITNLNALNKGVPAPGSLFDYDIFGFSTSERRNIPAYIDLKGLYLHPLAYITLKNIKRELESIVLGVKNYSISEDGKLVPDPNGDTGIQFLYDNWNKLKFKDTESVLGAEKIKNIQDRNSIFISKIIVIPAFYRDINTNDTGRISMDEINQKYLKIIRLVDTITKQEQYGFTLNASKGRLQLLLNDLHDDIIQSQLKSKYSVFKHSVMGKNITLGVRLVISASQISNAERPEDVQVRFNHMGVPLAACCAMFFPFVLYGVREFLMNEFTYSGKYPVYNDKGEIVYVSFKSPESHFSDEFILKMIKKFIYGPTTRFETIPIPENIEGLSANMQITGNFGKDKTSINRDATWTDILFIVASKLLTERHMYATRYPIEDYYSINPSKMSILTTNETEPALIGNTYYKFYPKINPDKSSEGLFTDTLVLPSAYLPGYGADFDGDQMSAVGVFTNEANEEAERYTKDKKNLINLMGETGRTTQKDFVQTMYALTKHPASGDGIPVFKNLSRVHDFK